MSERERAIESWRLHQLLEAGYGYEQAKKLAEARHVDLRFACELVTVRKCNPVTAAEILL